jgi:hypothetical protein
VRRRWPLLLPLATLALPSGAATLYTSGIQRGSNYLECEVLNVGKKPVDVTVEVRAVTSPPPDFVSCKTVELHVVPGRVEYVEQYGDDCGAAGSYYAVFSFKGGKNAVRAHCYALENPAERAEAR